MPAPLPLSRFSIRLCLQGRGSKEIKDGSWRVKPLSPSCPVEALTWGVMGEEGLYSVTSAF